MKKMRIGVVSFEHMHALSYTRALCNMEGAQLVGIADTDEFRGTKMAYSFKTKYFSNYKELLDSSLDGVIICTNNNMHCEVSVEALKRKINILVEKPFAVTEEQAKLMLDTAISNDVKIMNAFPMRFNPSVIEAKAMVDAGEIGDILCITGL